MVSLLLAGPPPVEGAHSHFGLYWHNGNTISVSAFVYFPYMLKMTFKIWKSKEV